MTNFQKYSIGIALIFTSMIMVVSMVKIDTEGLRLVSFGIVFILLASSARLLSDSTDLKKTIYAGFQYQLVAYEKINEGETPTTYVTLKFTSKHGVSVIHTFTDINFLKEVSAVHVGEKFTAIIKDEKIVLI